MHRSAGSTGHPSRGRTRVSARLAGLGVTVGLVLLGAACTPTDEPADAPVEDPAAPDTALPGARDPDADLAPDPDIELPAGFELVIVPDPLTGPFQLGTPDEAVGWAVGTSLAPLEEVASGTDWWAFWEPRLVPLEPEVSNVRAMFAIPDGEQVRSVQVNVTPYTLEDVAPEDAQAIAEAFATIAEAQGSQVRARGAVPYGGPEVDEVAQVVQRIDPEVLARDVWQRFFPVPAENALWSVLCDGPTEDPTDPEADVDAGLEATCAEVLDSFRPPV